MYGYVIFTDIEKYSTLKDADLKIFFNKIIPVISEELKEYKESAIIWNTWGDAIFAIYDKAESAINMALSYRKAFSKINFDEYGIKKLNPRIAGNFGEFELIFDPVSGKQNVHGTLVNLTARIEPVTTPGEIFVTKEFRDMSLSSYDKVDNVRFEDMGEIKLPKNAGQLNLYRLCKREETSMKPAGLVHSKIDYQIQAPMKPTIKNKGNEKSIEDRLTANLNKKTFMPSEEKLNKLASVLKDEKTIQKQEKNFLENFIRSFKNNKKNKILTIIKSIINIENPLVTSTIIILTTAFINPFIHTFIVNNQKNIPFISPVNVVALMPWIWLLGYIISSFAVGVGVTLIIKKIIKVKNVIITPSLILLYNLSLSLPPHKITAATVFFMQNIILSAPLLWFFCFVGFSKGIEIAGDKIKSSKSYYR